ncbi:NADPH-dependent FMN reductase [Agrobacterium deltaense]|uniref:flavodoxin family protein n=1 Tax=Agrobacterium TaxID=357 RepID=UPI000745A595|nr:MULTISPECIES: flavodoxin family protein [Agrobacterium]KVK53973.1 NADPH-dependent FMN reductase [Agrobacterium sp. D14]RKF40678.1 NADPH-dependent FMN reductase [Agrobacterium deltaense]
MLISIVYHSGYGHTAKVAQLVAEGAGRVAGAEAKLIPVVEGDIPWDALEASDAIIFGSPTYNGLISAKFKQFMEASTKTAWFEQKWNNKVAAGFTNSGAQHGDKLNSLVALSLFAAQHGMIWVGLDLMPGNSDSKGSVEDLNRHGSWLGVMTQSNNDQSADETPNTSDLQTAAYLGERVAKVTKRFLAGAQ